MRTIVIGKYLCVDYFVFAMLLSNCCLYLRKKNSEGSVGNRIRWIWNRRHEKLEHDYAKAGWALSVYPEVRDNARNSLRGDDRKAVPVSYTHLTLPTICSV